MRIWIDFSNSPHPLLFAPIARRLQALGHDVGVTARDNAQTVELTLERWPGATIVGGPSPKSRVRKAEALLSRIRLLTRWARAFRPDVALSHNSYAQIVAARLLGLPVVTAMDYEGQPANNLAFRLADVILLPEALRGSTVRRQGAAECRTRFYPGLKEEIYLGDFEPDPMALACIGLAPTDRPLVVARTPPSRAAYHRFGNSLFDEAIRVLGSDPKARTVVLARHPEQREAIAALGLRNVIVPDHAIDSRSLIHEADLVLGAGGTMTREAALMGVPTYSLFAGGPSAVDQSLEASGRLSRLQAATQLENVYERPTKPRTLAQLRANAEPIEAAFVETLTGLVA